MTTCAECLTAVSTMRLSDMRADSAVSMHCMTCPECAGIVRETAYAEQRLSEALSELKPSLPVHDVVDYALTGSEKIRRLAVARWARGLLAAAGCVTFFFFMQTRFIPKFDPPQAVITETITLRCISPEQAMEIATPYLRSSAAIYNTKGLPIITIRGKRSEFVRAVAAIKSLDDAGPCYLPPAGTAGPASAAPAEVDVQSPTEHGGTHTHGDKSAGTTAPTPPPTTSSDIPKKD